MSKSTEYGEPAVPLLALLGKAFYQAQALEHTLAGLYGTSPHSIASRWKSRLRKMMYTSSQAQLGKVTEDIIYDLEIPEQHWNILQKALFLRHWIKNAFFYEAGHRMQAMDDDEIEHLSYRLQMACDEMADAVRAISEMLLDREYYSRDDDISERVAMAVEKYWVGSKDEAVAEPSWENESVQPRRRQSDRVADSKKKEPREPDARPHARLASETRNMSVGRPRFYGKRS
ncbi:MAG: hypothetical protein CME36_05860 [unclassified Hahellaceae]|nr:hypothetical protein [Hahellaceae bacterium]|tara:strand:- start:18181 stop:18870 length:690 start_codon:yes stop_codon:yes gene_type:complete